MCGTEHVLMKPSATLGKTSNSKTDSLALHYSFSVGAWVCPQSECIVKSGLFLWPGVARVTGLCVGSQDGAEGAWLLCTVPGRWPVAKHRRRR